jgi:hypothetical protein
MFCGSMVDSTRVPACSKQHIGQVCSHTPPHTPTNSTHNSGLATELHRDLSRFAAADACQFMGLRFPTATPSPGYLLAPAQGISSTDIAPLPQAPIFRVGGDEGIGGETGGRGAAMVCAGEGGDEGHGSAEQLKEKGNAAFKASNFARAEDLFSQAILKNHRCNV